MKQGEALPYLDTIETTQNHELKHNPYSIKASKAFSVKKEYEDIHGENRENNSEAIKSAEYYKHLTDELAGLLIYEDSILQERAEKMLDCGTFLEYLDDELITANFCRQRLCPNCQRRRSLKTCVDVKKMQELLKPQGFKYLHLVLTVPNCEGYELGDVIDKLYKDSSRFFKSKELKNKFKGVMRCLEVTYNGRYKIDCQDDEIHGKCFHPHLHCLVAVGKSYGSGKNYINHATLTGLWMASCNTSDFLNVYISAIKGDEDKAIAEIAKYCVKPLELTCHAHERRVVVETLFSSLHGRRLVQLYGCFREVAKTLKIDFESLSDERKNIDTSNIKRYTYNRHKRTYELSGGF